MCSSDLFKLLAAHTTLTVAKYAVQSVNSSMTESIPSKPHSPDCTLLVSAFLVSPPDSAIRPADAHRDAAIISSLLERYADQLEFNCSLLEQTLHLSSKVHE